MTHDKLRRFIEAIVEEPDIEWRRDIAQAVFAQDRCERAGKTFRLLMTTATLVACLAVAAFVLERW